MSLSVYKQDYLSLSQHQTPLLAKVPYVALKSGQGVKLSYMHLSIF